MTIAITHGRLVFLNKPSLGSGTAALFSSPNQIALNLNITRICTEGTISQPELSGTAVSQELDGTAGQAELGGTAGQADLGGTAVQSGLSGTIKEVC